MAINAIAELLDDWIDHDLIGSDGLPAMTAFDVLKLIGYDKPTNPRSKERGAVLLSLLGAPKNIKGRDRWRVQLRQPTAADLMVGSKDIY